MCKHTKSQAPSPLLQQLLIVLAHGVLVQVEEWERKTLLGLRRTIQLIHTFSSMRNLTR
jgi:hypothetical protein